MYSVRTLPRAEADVQAIFDWLRERAPDGAMRWYAAFLSALDQLRQDAARFSTAEEAAMLGDDLRQVLFRTRRGRSYRIVFVVMELEVLVLRVRGPGQPPLQADEVVAG